jgi:hypothetical protein
MPACVPAAGQRERLQWLCRQFSPPFIRTIPQVSAVRPASSGGLHTVATSTAPASDTELLYCLV